MFHHQLNQRKIYFRIRVLAREMRKNSTPAEDFFWQRVRDRKLFGLKWNRQFIIVCPLEMNSIKYYIADFHCHQLKLVVELDGQIHLKQKEQDLLRTEQLIENGFTVLRFENKVVLEHWEDVEKIIKEYMDNSMLPL
jgi:very-short-patch-repair endonuclease